MFELSILTSHIHGSPEYNVSFLSNKINLTFFPLLIIILYIGATKTLYNHWKFLNS